jgi:hypothetical protein
MFGESGEALIKVIGDRRCLLEQPTGVYRRRFSSSARGNDRVSCSGSCAPAVTGLFPRNNGSKAAAKKFGHRCVNPIARSPAVPLLSTKASRFEKPKRLAYYPKQWRRSAALMDFFGKSPQDKPKNVGTNDNR